ncbi:MAG TPA: hypothetical protein VJP40_02205 [bacterium]|nr:hypothetical protein [bacterium]
MFSSSVAALPAPNYRERLEAGLRRFENLRSDRPGELLQTGTEVLGPEAAATELQVQIDQALAESDPAARRPLLIQALSTAAAMGDETDAQRIRSLLNDTLPADGLPEREVLRLEILVSAHEAVRGQDLEIESQLRQELEQLCAPIAARERALLTPEELRGHSLPPNHQPSGTTAELVQRARVLTLARTFYLSTGNSERANFLFLSLRRVRTELRASIREASSQMDAPTYAASCRALAELSLIMVDSRSAEIQIRSREIYEGLIAEARSRGQDVSWSHQQRAIREQARQAAVREYGEGLRRDTDRWLVAIGRLRRATPPVAMEQRLEHCRAASLVVRALRTLREGDEPLIAQATLDFRSNVIGRLWTHFFEDSLEQRAGTSTEQAALAQDIVYDLRTRVHFAMADNARAEDVAWISSLNAQGMLEFAQSSQAAHLLTMDRRQDPPTPAELQACLQAAQLYASLGLNNRVREITRPLSSYAYSLNESDPAQAAQRANLLLVLAQIYAQTGNMDAELNNALQGIVALDRPGELHRSAQLARAMTAMHEGNLLEARNFLRTIPDHPMTETFLRGIQDGLRAQRIAQIIGVLRAVSLNYIELGRQSGQNMSAVERDTLGGWQEIQRLMMTGEAANVDEALRQLGASGRFPNFTLGTGHCHVGSNVGAFIGTVSNPDLSDGDFHDAIFSLGAALRMDDYFQAASQIYQMMDGDPRVRERAREHNGYIPYEQGFHGGLNGLRVLMAIRNPLAGLALASTSGSSAGEMVENTAMVFVPFGVARVAAVGAEGLFVARATGGTIRLVRGGGLMVEAGPRSVRGLAALSFGVRTTTESVVFTASSMALHSAFARNTDNWTWGNFGREFGSMLLTFGLCHGIGYGVRGLGRAAARFESLRAPGLAAELGSEALRPGARRVLSIGAYSSTITGLTGLTYLNEALGLHPSGDVPLAIRVMNSALMDAQMRAAGRGIDAVSGGRISTFEGSTHRAQVVHDLLPALDRLGLPRPDADGRMTASTAMVLGLLRTRVAEGEDPAAILASLNPSPRSVRVARSSPAWTEWLRAHALGMAFLFTGADGFGIGRISRRPPRPAPENPWWNEPAQRTRLEDQFADQDFADVYWPSEASEALRLGRSDSPVEENQLAALATVLARAPEGAQPPVRIELASLGDPNSLAALLPLLRRGFAFEVQVPDRGETIRLDLGEGDTLLAEGMDPAMLRALAPRLRDFTKVTLSGVRSEAEALALVRTAAETEGPELVVLNGEGREWVRYWSGGFNVNNEGLSAEYLERIFGMAGRRPVRIVVDDLPLLSVSRGPQGMHLNLELRRATPAQVLAILRRVGDLPETIRQNAEIRMQNLEPALFRRPEIQQALAALTRTALAAGTRRLSLSLSGARGQAAPLAFRLTPNQPVLRTRYQFESDLPAEQIPDVLAEYLGAESAEIFGLGNRSDVPSREQLSGLWRAAFDHVAAYAQHSRAGEAYRPYWNGSGSVEGWIQGITNLSSYARARGNAARVQRALSNILQFSELEGSTVLASNGFSGRALGDNAFELLRLAHHDQGHLGRALEIVGGLMGRHGNVEVGGALVGLAYKTLIAGEGGARHEVNVLREQYQAALADGGRRYRFVIIPEDRQCRTTTPEWAIEVLDGEGHPISMAAVEVKSRNVQSRDFNERSLRETLEKAIQQLTPHRFSSGIEQAQAILALRFSNVAQNSSLNADVARLVSAEYRRLRGSSRPEDRAAAERMTRMTVEIHLQGPGSASRQVRLVFENGQWSEESNPFRVAG